MQTRYLDQATPSELSKAGPQPSRFMKGALAAPSSVSRRARSCQTRRRQQSSSGAHTHAHIAQLALSMFPSKPARRPMIVFRACSQAVHGCTHVCDGLARVQSGRQQGSVSPGAGAARMRRLRRPRAGGGRRQADPDGRRHTWRSRGRTATYIQGPSAPGCTGEAAAGGQGCHFGHVGARTQ